MENFSDRNCFGIRIKGGTGIPQDEYCFSNNRVVLGWSEINFSQETLGRSYLEIKAVVDSTGWYKNSRSLGQASGIIFRASQIKKGDIIIVPRYQSVAVAEVVSEHVLFDGSDDMLKNDISNYYLVNWIHRTYPKTLLSSNFNSTCKFRQTVIGLDYYKDDIEKIIQDTDILPIDQKYLEKREELALNNVEHIFNHIRSRDNVKFSDDDFELFVKHLFEITFNLKGEINSKLKEFENGRDIVFNVNGLGEIQWNVQVKQHQDETGEGAVNQILKGGIATNEINMVVSNTYFSTEAKKLADENNVILVDGYAMAEIIYENFQGIELEFKAKLSLYERIE